MVKKIFFNFYLFFIPCQENNFRPKFLKSKILFWCLLLLIFAKLIVISFTYLPKTHFFADLMAALTKTSLIEMTNQEREAAGQKPLKINQTLEQAAYLKAQDMMEKDYFSHYSPTGREPWDWLREVNYNYKYAGENLAIGFLDSEEVIKAWDESPSHRANLLSPNFQEIGIAVWRGNFQGSETTLVVQFFGSPLKKEVTPLKIAEEPKPKKPESLEKEVIPKKEEILPEKISKEEIPSEPEIPPEKKDSLTFHLFQFLAKDYPNFLEKIIFYFLILIIIALILNIFIKIDIQDKFLIFQTIILILLLVLLIILDKELIIQLIPHNFHI